MSKNLNRPDKTMLYRPDAVSGARKSEGRTEYYYQTFADEEVELYLDDGWFSHWDDFPKGDKTKTDKSKKDKTKTDK